MPVIVFWTAFTLILAGLIPNALKIVNFLAQAAGYIALTPIGIIKQLTGASPMRPWLQRIVDWLKGKSRTGRNIILAYLLIDVVLILCYAVALAKGKETYIFVFAFLLLANHVAAFFILKALGDFVQTIKEHLWLTNKQIDKTPTPWGVFFASAAIMPMAGAFWYHFLSLGVRHSIHWGWVLLCWTSIVTVWKIVSESRGHSANLATIVWAGTMFFAIACGGLFAVFPGETREIEALKARHDVETSIGAIPDQIRASKTISRITARTRVFKVDNDGNIVVIKDRILEAGQEFKAEKADASVIIQGEALLPILLPDAEWHDYVLSTEVLLVPVEKTGLANKNVSPASSTSSRPHSDLPEVSDNVNGNTVSKSMGTAWLRTGKIVRNGDRLKITATGRGVWKNIPGAYEECGPDGTVPSDPKDYWSNINDYLCPSGQKGALIGKIGQNGQPFLIGSNFDKTMTEDGELFVGINDQRPEFGSANWTDNSGGYQANVTIGPENQTQARAILIPEPKFTEDNIDLNAHVAFVERRREFILPALFLLYYIHVYYKKILCPTRTHCHSFSC